MALAHPAVHRLTTAEYDRLVASGALEEDLRVELIDGLLVDMTPPGPEHAAGINALMRLLGGRLDLLNVQQPLACAEGWTPQPDLALTESGGPHYHPTMALLVVEVIVSARAEAERKLPGYARAGVPLVWLVDVPARAVEVLSGAEADAYADRRVLRAAERLDPQVPGVAPFSVTELFAAAGFPD